MGLSHKMKVYRLPEIPSHKSFLPVEPSQNDAPYDGWSNIARAVWTQRNPSEDWSTAEQRCYPAIKTGPLAGWLQLRGQTAALCAGFASLGMKSGQRGTHPTGIGAKGTAKILPIKDIPQHPFFREGREFPLRLRHANGSFEDDAGCTLRGCSLKFADTDYDSPFDMNLNSGTQGPLWSVESFFRFAKVREACDPEKGDFEAQAKLMDEYPAYLMSWIESVRDAPSSFADLTYTSQCVFPFVGDDGVLRYCRYRLRRPDLEKESGLCSEARQMKVWNMQRDPNDDRPANYLREEFSARLKKGTINYRLQIQVRDQDASKDDLEIFHLNRPWYDLPWIDLAEITLQEELPTSVMERTAFSLGHQPEGLGSFHAYNASDYRSVVWSRLRIYEISKLMRALRGSPAA